MKLFIFIMAILGPSVVLSQTGYNLRELRQDTRPWVKDLASSVAAMVPNQNLQAMENSYRPIYPKLTDRGYCPKFVYANQPSFSECTGTLISERYILTAGHCADIKDMCKNYKWVFDYKLDELNSAPSSYQKQQIYDCKKIITSINVNPKFGLVGRLYQTYFRTDFAIIELDRKVRDRRPVVLSSQEMAVEGESIFSISYPLGMPAKVNFDGEVQGGLNNESYFWTSLTVFGGSSGGPIFEENTGHLIGVISKGISATMRDSVNQCLYEKRPDSDSSYSQTNSNAQMKKILEVVKEKKIPITLD